MIFSDGSCHYATHCFSANTAKIEDLVEMAMQSFHFPEASDAIFIRRDADVSPAGMTPSCQCRSTCLHTKVHIYAFSIEIDTYILVTASLIEYVDNFAALF